MTIVLEALRTIALGEFIPFNWLTDPIEEKLNMTKDSKIFTNMGSVFLVLLLMIILLLVIALLLRACRRSPKVHNLALKLKRKLFWNSMLRSILTGYLKLSFSSLAAVAVLNFSDANQVVNSIISLVILISMCQYPFSFGYLLHRKRKELPLEETKQKYGSLYLGMRTETVL